MITLSASLSAATRNRTRKPAISLIHSQLRNAVPQLDWTRWYSGSESDTPHASCVAPDGSLVRVRNDAGTIKVSRVASPASGSTYSSWTSLTGAGVANAGVAIAAGASRLIIVYVKTGGTRLRKSISTDNGASWSTPADIIAANESATVSWCAVATEDNTQDDWTVWWNRGNTDLRDSTSSNGGSTWGAASTTDVSAFLSSFSGLAATANATDYQLVICGYRATSGDPVVAVAPFSQIGVLGTLLPVAGADAASGIARFREPSIVNFYDTCVLTFCEAETNNVSVTRTLLAVGTPGKTVTDYFSEPSPVDSNASFGAHITFYPGIAQWFLTTSAGVWEADYYDVDTEIGSFVTSMKARVTANSARLSAVLTSGNNVISSTLPLAIPGIAVGSLLSLRAGYASGTAGAEEFGSTWDFEISEIRWKAAKGTWQLTIEATGAWERARYTRARNAVLEAGAASSRAAYFRRALSRAGGIVTVAAGSPHAPSADWTTDHSPDFYATPGKPWAAVAAELLGEEAEAVYFDGPTAYVRSVSASDAADETYTNASVAAMPVVSLELAERPPAANWTRISSASRYTDAYLFSSIYRHGARLEHNFVADSDDNTKAAEYAAAAVSRYRWGGAVAAVLVSHWHPGLQLYDAVSIAEPAVSFAASTLRVLSLQLDYDVSRAKYDQILELGAL